MTVSGGPTAPINNINTLRDCKLKKAHLPTPNQSASEITQKSNIPGNQGIKEIQGKRAGEQSLRLARSLTDKEEERRFSFSSFTSQSSSIAEEAEEQERQPGHDQSSSLDKVQEFRKDGKRFRIFQEIVETERRYCQDLEFIKVVNRLFCPSQTPSTNHIYYLLTLCRTIEIHCSLRLAPQMK